MTTQLGNVITKSRGPTAQRQVYQPRDSFQRVTSLLVNVSHTRTHHRIKQSTAHLTMSETPKPMSITSADFLETLSRYDAVTSFPSQIKGQATEPRVALGSAGSPALDSLKDSEGWRMSLPDVIATRRNAGRAYLTHDELVNIMKCKMYVWKHKCTQRLRISHCG